MASRRVDRAAFLTSLIGQPWRPDRNCWDVAALVQWKLFRRKLPHVHIPDNAPARWLMATLAEHPERAKWVKHEEAFPGLLTAPDGALVGMARVERAVHIGVWIAPERKVIHCDEVGGVCFDEVPRLRANGWGRVEFYIPET